MKLNVLSDLHLGRGVIEMPRTDADIVILAGDIARPPEAIAWASQLRKPALYVPGNHEFYGGSIDGTVAELRRLATGTNVCILDDDAIVVDGVRFLGSTLWTDFMLFGEGAGRATAMREGQRFMRDFTHIRRRDDSDAIFTPADAAALFEAHARWLTAKFTEPFTGPTVVVTHHAPSRRSIHPRFADSPVNACFVSDAERLIDGSRAFLWIHGHTHDSFDYTVSGTRVVCNPRGYAKNGVNENARFDPEFCVEVG